MGRERACTYIEASGGGRQETEEPPWLWQWFILACSNLQDLPVLSHCDCSSVALKNM